MKRIFKNFATAAVVAAIPGTALALSQSNRTATADDTNGGRVVQISPDSGANQQDDKTADNAEEAKQPKYWLGLGGSPIENAALRTQLQLADDVGVLVASVVPNSPAEKAGLRQHDVIVAVNGEPISDLTALQKVVADGGKKPIELKIIRLAKEQTVKVTPEERPANAPQAAPGGQGGLNDFQQLFQQGGLPGGMRIFGNGMVLGGGPQLNLNQMPGGLSVNITREGDGPATVTVKKGDKTWTVKGDDEKALKELPDDVRPFVQQMLQGSQPGQMRFNFGDMQKMMGDLGQLDLEGKPNAEALRNKMQAARERTEKASQRLQQRLEQMEKQLQQLQDQIEQKAPADRTNHAEDASKT